MPKREFVSKHVYRTDTGRYYDSRTGKRLTNASGRSRAEASNRIKTRIRTEKGRLGFKTIRVESDARNKETGSLRYNVVAEVPVSYDPEENPEAARESARRALDEDEEDWAHFNVEV